MTNATSKDIKIPAADGGAFKAYIAYPDTTQDAPAIILIQEIFGINADMRKKCDDLAAQGYIAICPDLFWRLKPGIEITDQTPEEMEQAFALYNKFNEELGLTDLQTTLGYIRNDKHCTEKVGALGYCLGGKLAYMMACHTDIDASIGYYGVAIETILGQATGIEAPLMLHIAQNDEFVSPAAQDSINKALGDNPHVTLHTYDGVDHAFARNEGTHYNETHAQKANERTAQFFQSHLSHTE